MALNIGQNIFPPGQQVNTTYDFVDLADGTGIVLFLGGKTYTASGASVYRLARNEFYSDSVASSADVTGVGGGITTQAFTKIQDINFDLDFKLPRIIDGNAIISIPIGLKLNTSSAGETFVSCALKKISGSETTELFALTSGSILYTVEAFISKTCSIKADIPRTGFKEDDKLRLQVQQYCRANGTDVATAYLAYDPSNRTASGSAGTWPEGVSKLQIQIPFKIDI